MVLEQLAQLAWCTVTLNPNVRPIASTLHDRHFRRKHGPAAYYGQRRRPDGRWPASTTVVAVTSRHQLH